MFIDRVTENIWPNLIQSISTKYWSQINIKVVVKSKPSEVPLLHYTPHLVLTALHHLPLHGHLQVAVVLFLSLSESPVSSPLFQTH